MTRGSLFGLLGTAAAGLTYYWTRTAVEPTPPGPGPALDVDGWVQMQDAPGLEIRTPSRAWTTPAVRDVMLRAGLAAAQLGAVLYIGDVGPATRGAAYAPHASHRWGRDLDIAYTFAGFPTVAADYYQPTDVRLVLALTAIASEVERVGVDATRVAAFTGHGFEVSGWTGHLNHLHLRLRRELTAEPPDFLAQTKGQVEVGNLYA